MRVVIDTNVFVSAVIKNREPETIILFVAARPDIEWIVTDQILAEYKEVLSRKKFALPLDILQSWFEMLDSLTTAVSAETAISFPPDQKDTKFLECAVTSGANYFVTGDSDFKEAHKLLTTTILSVSQFKSLVCDALS
ncbi:MAG: putative toxin-antitoxin system toxin component, PIN family [Nitrospirae bacterium]|nr:MAG: putative toxin-antitoxin system toxin component, PIN family [Nitrospirota bacterium]